MLALKDVVIHLVVLITGWGSMVITWTPFMETTSNRQLFPAKFAEESTGAWYLGVHH
jgi:hypothetical protein